MTIYQYYINRDYKYHEFSLIHYLSIRSFLECNPNSKLILFTNAPIISRWYELLNSEYESSRFSTIIISESELDYDHYDCIAHLVDRLKINWLATHGGLVVDSDFICMRNLEWLDESDIDVWLAEERDINSRHYMQLSIGCVYSRSNSEFIKAWSNAYNSYEKGKGWTYYSGVVPDQLWKSGKYNVTVIPDLLIDPYTYTRDRLRDLFLHNRIMPADAYMFHVAESIAWDRYLKPLDLEHIMTVDTTFTQSVRKYVNHLWDSDRNLPKII